MRNPLRTHLAHALDRRFGALGARVDGLRETVEREGSGCVDTRAEIAALRTEVAALRSDLGDTSAAVQRVDDRLDDEVGGMLRALVSEDADNRRWLEALRARPDYARPYQTPDPLVSICIPTRADRLELLLERALPSALAQTHPAIEIVIVGDGFDPRREPRLQALGEPRVRFGDVTHRITDPDPERQWLAAATLPRQEARRMAAGLWITDLDDDDALRPDAVQRLLERARETEAEVTSGWIAQHEPGGDQPRVITGFPPGIAPGWSGLGDDWSGRACTAALAHEGLRCFTRQGVAAVLGIPGDLFLTIRMARAGVRFAELERTVYDYYPGRLWTV